MRKYYFVLYFVFVVLAAINCSAADTAPISVSIQCSHCKVKSGSKIKLLITVTNTSDHSVDVFEPLQGEAQVYNVIHVRDGSGKLLPFIGPRIGGGSVRGAILKPGEYFKNYAILSNDFDLTKPGKYTVTVINERVVDSLGPHLAWATQSSNSITITVIQNSGSADPGD